MYFLIPLIFNVLLGVIFYKKQIKIKRPVWTYRSDRLIGKREVFEDNIPIFSNNNDECYVSITKVLFFNNGSETIRKEDVKKCVRIIIPNDHIILGNPRILKSSRPEIGLVAIKNDNEIVLNFDFLDLEDGGLIEIVHSSQREVKQAFYPIMGRPYPDDVASTNDFIEYDFIKKINDTVAVHAEHLEPLDPLFSFSWEDIPGKDSDKLLMYIKDYFGVNWAENAEIIKSNDNESILILKNNWAEVSEIIKFKDNRTKYIIKNEYAAQITIENKEKATLRIGNNKTYELIIKKYKGQLYVFQQSIKIDGIILGVPNGIQLVIIREKGAKTKILFYSLLLLLLITSPIFLNYGLYSLTLQEFLSIISHPLPFLVLICGISPFVYFITRLITSIVTIPSWFNERYLK